MARIAGVNIPTNKRVAIALTYIHGIGRTRAKELIDALGIEEARRVNELSDAEVLKVREYIDANLNVEGDLRRETQMNIKRLMAYYRQTAPLIGYYHAKGKLRSVDGLESIETIQREIKGLLRL